MKSDYIKCMEDLKSETYARTKAETIVKVLKDTLEAKIDLEKQDKVEETEVVEEMEIDEPNEDIGNEDKGWEQQRNERKKINKRVRRNKSLKVGFPCGQCDNVLKSKVSLTEHEKSHIFLNCTRCDTRFFTQGDLLK